MKQNQMKETRRAREASARVICPGFEISIPEISASNAAEVSCIMFVLLTALEMISGLPVQ